MTDEVQTQRVRVLIADESEDTLHAVDQILTAMGHTVVAYAVTARDAADLVVEQDPDISVVVVDQDDEHALDLIEELAECVRGPVIALTAGHDERFLSRAAERGIYAFARPRFLDEIQGAIELALRRHADATRLTEQVDQLETALQRRGTIERAKGILMERHSVDERGAFELLRDHARRSNRRLADLATAVSDGHALLPGQRSRADAGPARPE